MRSPLHNLEHCYRCAPEIATEIGYKEEQLPPLPVISKGSSQLLSQPTTLIPYYSFSLLLMTMGRKGVPLEGLWEKAIANAYKQGAHRAEDGRGTAQRTYQRPLKTRTTL